jgi:crotonobetainyl-CoA:carnitine CoA-transferase CaiB-like acyl-CoA transferase
VPLQQKALPLSGSLACYNVYRTKDDRFLAVALLEPKFWETFCLKMNLNSYVNHQMQSDQRELKNVLAETLAARTLDEWLDIFSKEDFCITPVKDFAETIEDPQILHRKMLLNISYPSGTLKQFKTPFVSVTTATSRAPVLGEHNVETLIELGFSAAEIATLKEDGIL